MTLSRIIFLCFLLQSLSSGVSAQQDFRVIARLDNTKIRQCVGLSCPVVEKVSRGTILNVIDVGGYSIIEGYGVNAWLLVETPTTRGYVYGAVVQLDISKSGAIPVSGSQSGYADADEVNVRACMDTNCPVLFKIPGGAYFTTNRRSGVKKQVGSLGKYYWYEIKYNKKTGYIFGGVIQRTLGVLNTDQMNVPVLDQINGNTIDLINRGKTYRIVQQSMKSEVVRPYGRNYWYRIQYYPNKFGWVYGGLTSKRTAKVDCQCVDYLKILFNIKGPTRHATDWGDVMTGDTPVQRNNVMTQLNYRKVTTPDKGDVAVFDKLHPEADPTYGHVGIVSQLDVSNGRIEIEGGNHKELPRYKFYQKKGCNNISKKWYALTDEISFYRK